MTNSTGASLDGLISEGVSPWWDGLDRRGIDSGWFASMVGTKGVSGATADQRALLRALGEDVGLGPYRDQLADLARQGASPEDAVIALAAGDGRAAGDALYEVFTHSDGQDGYVSVDVPAAAVRDPRGAVPAALRATAELARPNVMVKLPATELGLAAMRACLARGIGVHATEVYSPARYRQAVDAYFDGLAAASAAGLSVAAIPSVVAVPVGRIDEEVDARLVSTRGSGATDLLGAAGLATARLLYREYEHSLGTGRWRALHAAGARPQRLVWVAATDTDPGTRYAGRVVGWGTVTALQRAALDTLEVAEELAGDTLLGEHAAAQAVVEGLGGLGVGLDEVARELEWDGTHRVARYWEELSAVVRDRLAAAAD
ncbi:transaldolase family protein [Actinokineospora globicatena]|uniref:Transaldolase n=1 Tax=Actinokineospora globicatena TaxID=103729 RepID=A0A9W6QHU2_9PSEU|nr:transaldolase family protein [Actinokineospora globicatena]GLW90311.1 transaldolase 1 [Actinokineospora globicatena]